MMTKIEAGAVNIYACVEPCETCPVVECDPSTRSAVGRFLEDNLETSRVMGDVAVESVVQALKKAGMEWGPYSAIIAVKDAAESVATHECPRSYVYVD